MLVCIIKRLYHLSRRDLEQTLIYMQAVNRRP